MYVHVTVYLYYTQLFERKCTANNEIDISEKKNYRYCFGKNKPHV